ncbi:hypothetical protein V8G54_035569 [Vigna mungo]|uniref:Uncharacterized protein n=1 Tax=Vigna mungo TaxID=3915 RepID=A0AAQ3RFT1_VIGMU
MARKSLTVVIFGQRRKSIIVVESIDLSRVPLQIVIGQLESSLPGAIVWDDDGEGIDEEDSSLALSATWTNSACAERCEIALSDSLTKSPFGVLTDITLNGVDMALSGDVIDTPLEVVWDVGKLSHALLDRLTILFYSFTNCELRSMVIIDRGMIGSSESTTNFPGKIPRGPDVPTRIQFFVDRNKLNHMTIFKIPFSGHKTLVKLGARFEDDKQDVRQEKVLKKSSYKPSSGLEEKKKFLGKEPLTQHRKKFWKKNSYQRRKNLSGYLAQKGVPTDRCLTWEKALGLLSSKGSPHRSLPNVGKGSQPIMLKRESLPFVAQRGKRLSGYLAQKGENALGLLCSKGSSYRLSLNVGKGSLALKLKWESLPLAAQCWKREFLPLGLKKKVQKRTPISQLLNKSSPFMLEPPTFIFVSENSCTGNSSKELLTQHRKKFWKKNSYQRRENLSGYLAQKGVPTDRRLTWEKALGLLSSKGSPHRSLPNVGKGSQPIMLKRESLPFVAQRGKRLSGYLAQKGKNALGLLCSKGSSYRLSLNVGKGSLALKLKWESLPLAAQSQKEFLPLGLKKKVQKRTPISQLFNKSSPFMLEPPTFIFAWFQ